MEKSLKSWLIENCNIKCVFQFFISELKVRIKAEKSFWRASILKCYYRFGHNM